MIVIFIFYACIASITESKPYDPTDKEIESIISPEGSFEAFYPREVSGIPNGNSRASHQHGSFYKFRHPALVEVRNAGKFGMKYV